MTEKQKADIFYAKQILENKGHKPFETKLSETDCKQVAKTKKLMFIKYKSTELEITPEYAEQIININQLLNYRDVLSANKDKFSQQVGSDQFDLLYNAVYCALSVYNYKLDNVKDEKYSQDLVKICDSKIRKNADYYGVTYNLEPQFSVETKLLKTLLKFNTDKIVAHLKQVSNIEQFENQEEMDK